MLTVCHHLDKRVPKMCLVISRFVRKTIAREDILHDMGVFSIMSSDSQAMGRVGEVVTRTWQTATKQESATWRASEAEDPHSDNFRIKRYIAKYTD